MPGIRNLSVDKNRPAHIAWSLTYAYCGRGPREVGGRNAGCGTRNPERDIAGRGMKSETRRMRTQNENLEQIEKRPRILALQNLEPENMRVLNTQQMREADRQTIDDIGIPSLVLMENAGRQAVAAMEAAFDDLADEQGRRCCAVAETTAATVSWSRGHSRSGASKRWSSCSAASRRCEGDARTNLEILGRIGLTVIEIADAQEWELHFSEVSECDLIVDAIFGTGFHGPLTGLLETVVADVNGLGVPVVAIDLPTGLSADSHELDGEGDRSRDDRHARRAQAAARLSAGRCARAETS